MHPAHQSLIRVLHWREAIASVALSHAESCKCETCRAASGDEEAFARLVERMEAHDDH